MESFNEIITAISTVGFPCVCTLILMHIVYKMNESHKAEISDVKEAINNNTIALTKLLDKLEEAK